MRTVKKGRSKKSKVSSKRTDKTVKRTVNYQPSLCSGVIDSDGTVSTASSKIKLNVQYRDLHDILCVLYNKKPLALVHLPSTIVPKGVESRIMKLAIENDIRVIRISSAPNAYSFIFFNSGKSQTAKLYVTLIREYKESVTPYAIGTLLGYTDKKITGFYKRNSSITAYNNDRHAYLGLLYTVQINNSVLIEKIDDVFTIPE